MTMAAAVVSSLRANTTSPPWVRPREDRWSAARVAAAIRVGSITWSQSAHIAARALTGAAQAGQLAEEGILPTRAAATGVTRRVRPSAVAEAGRLPPARP